MPSSIRRDLGWTYKIVDLSDNSTTIYDGPALLRSIWVDVVMSAHALLITDAAVTIFTIPASQAAAVRIEFGDVIFETSLIFNPDDDATGTIVVAYKQVPLAGP